MHGEDDERVYAGEHRGDMEAEAEAVAYGLLTAWGQSELARDSVRYVAQWTGSPERVAAAYEKAPRLVDAVAGGADDLPLAQSPEAQKRQTKNDNWELAAALRVAATAFLTSVPGHRFRAG